MDELRKLLAEAQITEPLCVDYKELGAEDNRRLYAFLMEGDAEDGAIVCVDEEPVGRDVPSPRLELIAAAVNALPELLAENARLREAFSGPAAWLDRWAQHVGNCKGGHVCTCGLTLARTEARTALKETGHE